MNWRQTIYRLLYSPRTFFHIIRYIFLALTQRRTIRTMQSHNTFLTYSLPHTFIYHRRRTIGRDDNKRNTRIVSFGYGRVVVKHRTTRCTHQCYRHTFFFDHTHCKKRSRTLIYHTITLKIIIRRNRKHQRSITRTR